GRRPGWPQFTGHRGTRTGSVSEEGTAGMTAAVIRMLDDERLRPAAARVRPDVDPDEVIARVAWSVLVEPGDGVAGTLIAEHGARRALQMAVGESSLLAPGSLGSQQLSEALARWRPRARAQAVVDAMASCADIGGRLLLPGGELWPAGL